MMLHNKRFLSAFVFIALFALPVYAQPVTKQLAPGVTLMQEIDTNPSAPLVVNTVVVDLAHTEVNIKAAIGQDVVYSDDPTKGRETVSKLTSRRGALLGINADFFPFTGDPLGICIIDGEIISEAPGNRAALAVTENRSVFFDTPSATMILTTAGGHSRAIDGINRICEPGQIVIYTEAFGASTRGQCRAMDVVCASTDLPVQAGKTIKLTITDLKENGLDTPIPKGGVVLSGEGIAAAFLKDNVRLGDTLTVRFDVRSPRGRDWSQVRQAVGGGPWLVRDGKEWIDDIAEKFPADFASTRHPRTAAGVTTDNKLLFVTVDGRQTISRGISLSNLAALMIRLGAVNAINLDGGGSTTLSAKGIILNSPSGGEERPVANALLVFAPSQIFEIPALTISGAPAEAVSGRGLPLRLTCAEDAKSPTEDQLKNVIWGTTKGIGFVNQSGYFTPLKAGKGALNALIGSQIVTFEISVVPGPPTKATAELIADKQNSLVCAFKATALDANGNLVPAKEVLLNVTGGKAELESGVTDAKGEFTTNITWDQGATDRRAAVIIGDGNAEARLK